MDITKAKPSIKQISYTRIYYSVITISSLVLATISFQYFSQDDSFIYYTYVKNITNGQGYVFNSGVHYNATTSALYTLLISLVAIIGLPIPIAGNIVCCVGLAALIILAYKIFPAHFERVSIWALFVLASPALSFGVGMETYLTLSLLAGSYVLYLKEKYSWAGLVLGLAILSRPDSLLFGGVLAADYIFLKKKRNITPALLLLLPIIPWLLFSWYYFGSFLPASFFAKTSQMASGFWQADFLDSMPRYLLTSLWFIPTIMGLYLFASNRLWFKDKTFSKLIAWSAIYLFTYGIILNTPDYTWYYVPLIVGWAMIMAYAFRSKKYRMPLAVGLLLVSSFQAGRLIYLDRGENQYKLIAEYLNNHASPGDSLGSAEIGYLGYYYNQGPIVDLVGLVTPGVAEHIKNQDFSWSMLAYQPDYVVVGNPPWPLLHEFVDQKWFREKYILEKKYKSFLLYKKY